MGSFIFCQVNKLELKVEIETPQCWEIKHLSQFGPLPITTEKLMHFLVDAAEENTPT